jgi:type III pantothenate kinase
MLLAIDAGNTNTVFAVHDGTRWRAQWRASTSAERTADEYVTWLSQLMAMQEFALDSIEDCIISTVVPQSLFNLRTLCKRYFHVDPLVIGEGVDLGIRIEMDRPGEVGADRLVNAVGAHVRYDGPLLIIDSGTATTFDVVDADGTYQGGIIAPGVHLSLEALHRAAAKLPRVAIARPDRVVGKNTVTAMQAGVFWGYIGLIEGVVARVKAEYRTPMTVVATGGVMTLFQGATDVIEHFDSEVTIRGLYEIYLRNARTFSTRRIAAAQSA